MVSLGGQAPHVRRAHMGRMCGEPTEFESPAAHLTGNFIALCHMGAHRTCGEPTEFESPAAHLTGNFIDLFQVLQGACVDVHQHPAWLVRYRQEGHGVCGIC